MKLLILLFISVPSYAAHRCTTDDIGNQRCSRYQGGLAIKTGFGIVCSKGDCAKDNIGNVRCSKQPGGGALRTNYGTVKCTGGCESPSQDYCTEMAD